MIDENYYQSINTNCTIPANQPLVFVDGKICSCLNVIEITKSNHPHHTTAELEYNFTDDAFGRPTPIENIESLIGIGRQIKICSIINGNERCFYPGTFTIFSGFIESVESLANGENQKIIFSARDYSIILENINIVGSREFSDLHTTVFKPDVEAVFNRKSAPDRSQSKHKRDSKASYVFDRCNSRCFWQWVDVVEYILKEYIPYGQLTMQSADYLATLSEAVEIMDLNLQGLSILEALHKCARIAGLKFALLPNNEETGPAQRIEFYKIGHSKKIPLSLQWPGETFNTTQTTLIKFKSERKFSPVSTLFRAVAEPKTYEATFELVKAWDPSLEGETGDCYDRSSSQFETYKNVYRKWCLNENGDYTISPYNRGPAYDFSVIFEDKYEIKRRRFYDAISTDCNGKSLGLYLEVSYDGGSTWQPYSRVFRNLTDECGIWLTSDSLSYSTWNAIVSDDLKFRITASVHSDKILQHSAANGPLNSTALSREVNLFLPRKYRYRKVTPYSQFYNSEDSSLGTPDEADDRKAMKNFVRLSVTGYFEPIEKITAEMPLAVTNINAGDIISHLPGQRDILNISRDPSSVFWVDKVKTNYRKQSTIIKILRARDMLYEYE